VLAAGTAVRLAAGPAPGRLADRLDAPKVILALCSASAALIALGYLPIWACGRCSRSVYSTRRHWRRWRRSATRSLFARAHRQTHLNFRFRPPRGSGLLTFRQSTLYQLKAYEASGQRPDA
jgi:hypothetical protein